MRVLTTVGVGLGVVASVTTPVLAVRPPQQSILEVDSRVPGTLEALCNESSLIVEGVVQAVFPSTVLKGGGSLATDSLIEIKQVLKGSERPGDVIVISQLGGSLGGRIETSTHFDLMRPGEEYVLFLARESAGYTARLPVREGIQRYATVSHAGYIRVDGENPRLSVDFPYYSTYIEKRSAEILSDVRAYATSRR